ncbi:MAG: hypothetical protein SGI86_21805 [Deltaproteobacteria bacterium]|nr:hypothetical protein [Deltaproteobacteria bacterium]
MGLFNGSKKQEDIDVAPVRSTIERIPAKRVELTAEKYGIEKAIELMRTLPSDEASIGLVVQVIKKTLESLNVSVESIIGDAARKQLSIEERIEQLGQEVSALENEIKTRREETVRLQSDHAETTRVKERLMMTQEPVAGGSEEGSALGESASA